MKKIAIILANEMDDVELFIPLAIWRKAKISVDLISVEKKNSVMMSSGVKVGCTSIFESVNLTQYHAIYIPGGVGVNRLNKENWPVKTGGGAVKLATYLEKFRMETDKYIFVTGSSATLLHNLGLIGNARIAGYTKDFEEDVEIDEEILVNNNLISVVGYWALTDFAVEIVGILMGQKIKEQISKNYN
ncbi:DJ-1/PfpI family protein [Ureaplasma ceti]|uniref:DJ-1/PfpI family protein n=1 Tax=Ureaplasma ceti TaxID=3119530 RepID=A0ABP9U4Q3_9BACT